MNYLCKTLVLSAILLVAGSGCVGEVGEEPSAGVEESLAGDEAEPIGEASDAFNICIGICIQI